MPEDKEDRSLPAPRVLFFRTKGSAITCYVLCRADDNRLTLTIVLYYTPYRCMESKSMYCSYGYCLFFLFCCCFYQTMLSSARERFNELIVTAREKKLIKQAFSHVLFTYYSLTLVKKIFQNKQSNFGTASSPSTSRTSRKLPLFSPLLFATLIL